MVYKKPTIGMIMLFKCTLNMGVKFGSLLTSKAIG